MKNDLPLTSGRELAVDAWNGLVDRVAEAYSMAPARRERLRSNATARLVAAIPYLAGCDEPERTALAHLGTFVLAGSEACRRAFDHKPEDDAGPLVRLETGSHFHGGNPVLIARGMRLLAMVMINGYRQDAARDLAAGEYNPVAAGVWDADRLLTTLKEEVEAVPCAPMDEIMDPERAGVLAWSD